MTKVLEVICEPFVNGGEEAFIINLISNIGDEFLVDLYAPYGFENNRYKAIIEKYGGEVFVNSPSLNLSNLRLNIIKPLWIFLKKHKYDVVHIHSSRVSPLALASFAAKLNNQKKICVHSHSIEWENSIQHKIAKAVMAPLFFICPTDYLACSIEAGKSKYPKPIVKRKLKVIKNGIEINSFILNDKVRNEMRKQLSFSKKDKIIGHVGRFSDEKNHDFLIDVFYELRKKSDTYKLLLLGDGELKEKIVLKSDKLGLIDYITFTGNVSNVPDYLQAMDLFVLPSKCEGFGIVGIEAQTSGLPCIFSDGVPKMAKVTSDVIFVSLSDREKWVSEIEKMILLPKVENTEIVRKAGFDVRQMAFEIGEIYKKR